MEDHYQTLGLLHARADANLTPSDIKQAYRKALLQYHPDKSTDIALQERQIAQPAAVTVDQITIAYKTLSDPVSKAKYDRLLALTPSKNAGDKTDVIHYSGLDVVDLDDLEYNDDQALWWRSCRCGQDQGFLVHEHDLEKEAQHGELFTGCRGCSLWLKVLFDAVDDSAESVRPTPI